MPSTPFTVDSPTTRLAVTATGGAVTGIQLNRRGHRPPESPFERRVASEFDEYFRGERTYFTFPIRLEGTDFELAVWSALQAIPYGETRTYGEIAQAIGQPNAARAVGMANGKNPLPIVVPCHRVVAAGGKLGGFGGGVPLKRRLLALESAHATPMTSEQ